MTPDPDEWLPFAGQTDMSASMEGLASRLAPPQWSLVNTPAFQDRGKHQWWAYGPAIVWPDGTVTLIWLIG